MISMEKTDPIRPRYSILITSFRSLRFLDDCLGTLLKSTGPSYEVLFLDNGSPEPEADWIESHFQDPRLQVFRLTETRYYPGGINFLANHAKGEFLIPLNSDTRMDPNWLIVLDEYLRTTGFEAAQADVRTGRDPEERESRGYNLDRLGRILHVSESQNPPPKRIFGVRGAAYAIRRDVFFEIGTYDESFTMYFEETDLCWRINLFGYRIGYAPGSIVYHLGGGSSSKSFFQRNQFRFIRNRILSLIKNYSLASLIIFLPLHLLFCVGDAFVCLLRGKLGKALSEGLAIPAAIFLLGSTLRSRKAIQTQRVVTDQDLMDLGLIRRKLKLF